MKTSRLACALGLGLWAVASGLSPARSDPPPRSLLRVTDQFLEAPGADRHPQADILILRDDIRLVVQPDGSTSFHEHDALKLLNAEGVESYGSLSRLYRQGLETIHLERARTISPDGRIHDLAGPMIDDRPLFPGSPLYGDLRRLRLQFPEASPGAVIEFKIRTDRAPRPGGAWWGTSYLQNPDPILDSTFEVRLPLGAGLRWSAPGLTPSTPSRRQEGETQILRWEARQVAPLVQEPSAPPWTHLLHRVEVSSFQDWTSVGEWLAPRWREAVSQDRGVAMIAAGLNQGPGRPRETAAAILGWVASTKTPSELLSGHLEPHPAQEILRAELISPIDSAVLIASLLSRAGLTVTPWMVSEVPLETLRGESPDPETVGRLLLSFEHPPGETLWIDPSSPGELLEAPPEGAQGVAGLKLAPSGVELLTTPVSSPFAQRRLIHLALRLDPGGRAEASMDLSASGLAASPWRKVVGDLAGLPAPRRQGLLDELFSQIAGGFSLPGRVYATYFPTQLTPGQPFQCSLTLMFPSLGQLTAAGGRRVELPLALYGADRLAGLDREPEARQYPIVIGTPLQEDLRVTLDLPPGSAVLRLPAPESITNELGSFFSTLRHEGDQVRLFSRLILRAPWIPASKAPLLGELARAQRRLRETPLILKLPAPAPSTPARPEPSP